MIPRQEGRRCTKEGKKLYNKGRKGGRIEGR
jgi:hypothetical protein